MNKQELIKKYEEEFEMIYGFPVVQLSLILEDLKQLDEPQKVTVPQFVADYIKDTKYYEWDLDDVFDHIAEESGESEISKWFYTLGNIDVFARAWLDGYRTEKEPRYTVRMKNKAGDDDYLVKTSANGLRFYNNIYTQSRKHTRKELESSGFGWVFNCPGMEVKEVE